MTNEYCVGPHNPDDAISFSRDTFCKEGRLVLCHHSMVKIIINRLHFIQVLNVSFLYFNANSIVMEGMYSCGGPIEYPDCSFCPIDNRTHAVESCHRDCRWNANTNVCEFKGMPSSYMRLEYL